MEIGIGSDLARGEADGAYSDGHGLTATPCILEDLPGNLAQGSDKRHLHLPKKGEGI